MSRKKRFSIPPPKTTSHFDAGKEPDYTSLKPAFSFRRMNRGKKGCLSKLPKKDRVSVVDTLLLLSQLTWSDIKSKPREGLGFEYMPRNEFKVAPPATPEVEKLMVFRYSDGGRIAGLRVYDTYHILIVGPKLYKH